MGVSLPYDIIVIIIRDHVDDRNALYALSLVSQSFCNIAQRVLFSTVELCYSANAPPRPNRPPEVVRLPPFKWRKLRFLARSDKLSRYVRSLIVLLTAGPGHHDSPLDEYWHQSGGRPILDELDRWLPPCLQHMSPLDKLIFVGPAIRAPVHQAILRHNTLRYLKATVRTHCVVPCRDAMQTRVRNTAIEELKFVDIGESEYTFGYLGCIESSTGPRRCAFLSHMIWTHSASLKVLRVGILLLYDALRPSSNFPDFPHLSSLHIEDAVGSPYIVRLDPEISFAAVAFILHVHETIVTLQWGLSVLEETTKLITANYLPNLSQLSGYRIRQLIRTHLPRKLQIIALSPVDLGPETDRSLLRETSSCLPNLSVLAISTQIRSMQVLHDLRTFTNLMELWYEEEPGCEPHEEESKEESRYPYDLFQVVLPALPKLRDLYISIKGDIKNIAPWDMSRRLKLYSRSLCSVTIQFVVHGVAGYGLNVFRENPESIWTHKALNGLHMMRSFEV